MLDKLDEPICGQKQVIFRRFVMSLVVFRCLSFVICLCYLRRSQKIHSFLLQIQITFKYQHSLIRISLLKSRAINKINKSCKLSFIQTGTYFLQHIYTNLVDFHLSKLEHIFSNTFLQILQIFFSAIIRWKHLRRFFIG